MINKKSSIPRKETGNKGYNETNPAQPEGAFPPGAADAPIPEERSTRKRLGDASKKIEDAMKKKNQSG